MKRAAIYARVSTRNGHQDPETQLLALRQVAERAGWHVIEEYVDHGISGAKGRDRRPAFDRLMKDATRRRFDVVMAWSVDRLGRSLQDPVAFLLRQEVVEVARRGFQEAPLEACGDREALGWSSARSSASMVWRSASRA